ncbi:MAG: hypothetical protein E7562_03935 [Ruminococcaceae bacterium]|nr:hypothetical protein [Oscillospiraceae bacterium]
MKKDNFKTPNETFENPGTAVPVDGQPETAFELIKKYGTYNIQPTAESDNRYPEIAQGFSKYGNLESDGENPHKPQKKQ